MHVEDLVAVAVEFLRPHMMPALGIDELRGDPDARTDLAHAAFDEIIDAELTAHAQQIEIAAAMSER